MGVSKKMRKRFYDIEPQKRKRMLKEFCGMISRIETEKNAEKFLRDLLTPGEIIMIMNRIEIAKMLLVGFPYADIKKKLKVGFNTIGNVNRWLYSGFGGYMNELKEAKNQEQRRKILPTNEWEAMKKKYPAHFLIFNLLDKIKK
jgi:uncharacterized protein YerC